MSGAFRIPGNLMAAQAASYAKGQEALRDNSKDKADESRLRRQQVTRDKGVEEQRRASDPQKGVLA